MLVSRIVNAVADELNDLEPGFEHLRWPLPNLFEYIYQALEQISALKPDLFSVRVPYTITNTSGMYDIPSSLAKLNSVIGTIDSNGRLIRNVDKSGWAVTANLGPSQCILKDRYSFIVNDDDPRTFYLLPVPSLFPKITVMLLGTETVQPIVSVTQDILFSGGNIDAYYNPIVDFTLYRAFAKDTESQSNKARSADHYKAFFDFFNLAPKLIATDRALEMQQGQASV